MKKYRLKKDLPGMKAGTIVSQNGVFYKENSVYTQDYNGITYFAPAFATAQVEYNPEWFEEVPDFFFVRDGDVYSDNSGEANSILYCHNGEVANFSFTLEKSIYDVVMGGGYDRVPYKSCNRLKPENLVYRPGVVDKLGWGDLREKKPEMVEMGPAVIKTLGTYHTTEQFYSSETKARRDWLNQFVTWPAYLVKVPKV